MQRTNIEDIVMREFTGLCSTCLHINTCTYHKGASEKIIIQCELFEADDEPLTAQNTAFGLCKNCDLASGCNLPGRKTGTWHCNEFE